MSEEKVKLVVMIPAYNEEETIGRVIGEIPRRIEGVDKIEVLVIDDGSTDTTSKVAEKEGPEKIIRHKANLGLGVAFRDGLEAALGMDAEVIVNIDADAQYNAKEISKLIEPLLKGEADMVLGNRQIDKLKHMPWSKRWGNKIATWVVRRVTGLSIRDAQTGFRAFSRNAALHMNLTGDYTYTQETIIQAAHKKLKIEQIPVEFRKRRNGKSRLVGNIFSYAKYAGITIIKSYRDCAPLKVFATMGTALILIGLAFGVRVLVDFFETGTVEHLPSAILTTVLIVAGLVVVIFGLLADMVKAQRILLEDMLYRMKKERREGKGEKENGNGMC